MTAKVPENVKLNPVTSWMWNRTHRLRNSITGSIVGLPGAGKSWAGLKLMEILMVDSNGNLLINETNFDDFVAFSFLEFSKLVTMHKRPGTCILWEESSSIESANARRFWAEAATYMTSLFAQMRYKRQIVFMTLPSQHFLDKQIRQITHFTLSMKGHNKNYSWGKFLMHSYNAEQNELYYKHPRFFNKSDGFLTKNSTTRFLPPAKWLRKLYEEKQHAWKDGQQIKTIAHLEKTKKHEELDSSNNFMRLVKEAESRWEDFYDEKAKKFIPEAFMIDDALLEVAPMTRTNAFSIAKILSMKKARDLLL